MTNKTENLKDKYKDLLPIDDQDYKDAKDYYEKYLQIFDGIIDCKDEESLNVIKKEIKENNPWENALNDSNQFRSVADSDRSILEPLIAEEINNFKDNIFSKKMRESFSDEVSTIYSQYGGEEEFNTAIKENLAKPFFKQIFSDFEHAFDGNFENPRVLILGINPKLGDIKHESYNLFETYSEPFNNRRKTLINKNENKDYYFKDNGFFFLGMNDSQEANNLKSKFKDKVTKEDEITPYALLEFYPYATKGITEWYGDISISETKILKYMGQKNFLPSQIWLLCLATFTIKKALFEPERELYIFCTKKGKTFVDSFLKQYLEVTLEITPTSNVKILLKKDDRNRSFNVNNINPYFENSGIVFAENDFKEFFRVIWNI